MSETLLEKLDRIESEIDKLKSAQQSNNKEESPDIKSQVEKVVDISYINNLYRNK
jgi:hypothetical protein